MPGRFNLFVVGLLVGDPGGELPEPVDCLQHCGLHAVRAHHRRRHHRRSSLLVGVRRCRELDRGLMGVLGGRGQPLHIRQGLLYQSLRRLTPIRLQQRVER